MAFVQWESDEDEAFSFGGFDPMVNDPPGNSFDASSFIESHHSTSSPASNVVSFDAQIIPKPGPATSTAVNIAGEKLSVSSEATHELDSVMEEKSVQMLPFEEENAEENVLPPSFSPDPSSTPYHEPKPSLTEPHAIAIGSLSSSQLTPPAVASSGAFPLLAPPTGDPIQSIQEYDLMKTSADKSVDLSTLLTEPHRAKKKDKRKRKKKRRKHSIQKKEELQRESADSTNRGHQKDQQNGSLEPSMVENKHDNDNGNKHYSDKEEPGAEMNKGKSVDDMSRQEQIDYFLSLDVSSDEDIKEFGGLSEAERYRIKYYSLRHKMKEMRKLHATESRRQDRQHHGELGPLLHYKHAYAEVAAELEDATETILRLELEMKQMCKVNSTTQLQFERAVELGKKAQTRSIQLEEEKTYLSQCVESLVSTLSKHNISVNVQLNQVQQRQVARSSPSASTGKNHARNSRRRSSGSGGTNVPNDQAQDLNDGGDTSTASAVLRDRERARATRRAHRQRRLTTSSHGTSASGGNRAKSALTYFNSRKGKTSVHKLGIGRGNGFDKDSALVYDRIPGQYRAHNQHDSGNLSHQHHIRTSSSASPIEIVSGVTMGKAKAPSPAEEVANLRRMASQPGVMLLVSPDIKEKAEKAANK